MSTPTSRRSCSVSAFRSDNRSRKQQSHTMSPKRMNSLWLMAIFLTVNFIFSVVLFFKWTSDLRCQRLQILDNTKKIQAKIHNKNVLSCQPPVLSLDREEMFHFFSKAPGIRPNCSESPNWIEIENRKETINEKRFECFDIFLFETKFDFLTTH